MILKSIVLVLFLCFSGFTFSLEVLPTPEGLVGGSVTSLYWQSVVKITPNLPLTLLRELRLPDGGACTAFFITQSVLLSAAHCFNPNRTHVALNLINAHGGIDFALGNLTFHPDYDSASLFHDLVIITLGTPISYARPLSLDTRPFVCDESLEALGFGRQTKRQAEKVSFLDKISKIFASQFKAITPSSSAWAKFKANFRKSVGLLDEFSKLFTVKHQLQIATVSVSADCEDEGLIVTKTENVSGCFGDSGGPLMRAGRPIGIQSHIAVEAEGVCTPGYENYATPIGNYIHFIQRHVPNVETL